jgi:hypothetical protein
MAGRELISGREDKKETFQPNHVPVGKMISIN